MTDNLKPFLIREHISVKDAMKQMDKVGRRILFVVDADNRILGVVTDGDIRRWILKEESLSESIARAMNRNPICITERQSTQEAKKLMAFREIECIPVVDKDKKIISAIWCLVDRSF
jgi:CBS domain-containing protein